MKLPNWQLKKIQKFRINPKDRSAKKAGKPNQRRALAVDVSTEEVRIARVNPVKIWCPSMFE